VVRPRALPPAAAADAGKSMGGDASDARNQHH
jgi:hypothetical protein